MARSEFGPRQPHAHHRSANLPPINIREGYFRAQDLVVRAGLPQTPESRVSSSVLCQYSLWAPVGCPSLGPGQGGRVGGGKGRREGTGGGGRGGASAHFL